MGLTCRIGRAVYGTIEIIDDFVETGKSILIMGRPGIGKTTMLREAARVLADDLGKRVVVVDTSNEIAGDGDIPHPAIGKARRMQVRTPALQHEVMIEAVENHMPQVIVIDEIGTELEAQAARTIAERGVQLIGTAHGNNLDNLMLNPTLSDLIGGIQSVTLGDEEARRRRTQKSVLERKAPPTFDVIVEIQDRERVMVHADVSETVDAMLRGDPVAAEQRWKDEAGVHKTQSRPRPSPARAAGPRALRRAGGLRRRRLAAGAGLARHRRLPSHALGPGRRREARLPGGSSGGWRESRGRAGEAGGRTMPGERISRLDERAGPGGSGGAGGNGGPTGPRTASPRTAGWRTPATEAPFVAGEIADRGPVERATPGETPAEVRAREIREWERQAQWRDQASRALEAFKAEEGTGPANVADLVADDERLADRSIAAAVDEDGPALRVETGILPTLRVYPHGISRKRLEQAIKELQLPVIVARLVDEADVVMTLRSEYRQKGPTIREAEDRALPVYVLKANTIVQMQASLTSIFSLEVDPREAALRETEEAIGLVGREAQPVELAPQNAYIRRLQHQMAERANVVSRSRGREPYRRVRLYPDEARAWR